MFSSTASVTSTDMNNMLRGLYRDNADHALTGTVAATDLASISIPANTIGTTGGIYLIAAGTTAGTAGTKTTTLSLGGVNIFAPAVSAANTDNWIYEAWIFNTATNAQRTFVRWTAANAASGAVSQHLAGYRTGTVDTTANQTLKIAGTLANAGDTITQTMFDVFIVQIT